MKRYSIPASNWPRFTLRNSGTERKATMPPKGWKKESPTKLTCVITWVATPKIIALQVELEKRKKCPDKGFFWREALHWFFNSETEEELKEIPRRPIGTKIVPV